MTSQSSAAANQPDGGSSSAAQPPAESNPSAAAPKDKDFGAEGAAGTLEAQRSYWQELTAGGIAGLALLLTLLVLIGRRRRKSWVNVVALIAGLVWVAAGVVAVGLYSWWLAAPFGVIALAAFPAFIRIWRRRDRLHAVTARELNAAEAAWQELLAESWDRGATIPDTDTVRMTARRLVREHSLDDEGMEGLRTVVGVIERTWYGGTREPDPALPDAVNNVRASMRRNAPLALRAKLMPRSILHPRRSRSSSTDPSPSDD
jgi:hypothetical protein